MEAVESSNAMHDDVATSSNHGASAQETVPPQQVTFTEAQSSPFQQVSLRGQALNFFDCNFFSVVINLARLAVFWDFI